MARGAGVGGGGMSDLPQAWVKSLPSHSLSTTVARPSIPVLFTRYLLLPLTMQAFGEQCLSGAPSRLRRTRSRFRQSQRTAE
jgi:hypothetical protein